MKHELVTVPGQDTLPEDFGVSQDAFESMVDNLNLEIHHSTIFSKDNRPLSQCLIDALDNLDPADFGLEPTSANHYLVIGLAMAKAIELQDAMMQGLKARAESRSDDVLRSLMRRMTEHEKEPGRIKTTGSVN